MTIRHPASLVILVVYLASFPLWCQGSRQLQDQLNSTFKGKVALLCNFYSGSDLRYDEIGLLPSEFARQIFLNGDLPSSTNCRKLALKALQEKGTDQNRNHGPRRVSR